MILNLTLHAPTPAQIEAGVVDLPAHLRAEWIELAEFRKLDPVAIAAQTGRAVTRAVEMARALQADAAMIGGALWLMGPLSVALKRAGVEPLFALSAREVVETPQPDGTVLKTAVFRHAGFMPALFEDILP